MLKQDAKRINSQFIRTRTLYQLSFVQFRPYSTLFPGLILSFMLMPKSKSNLESSLDLTLSFMTSVDAKVEGLISNVNYLENFIQKKYGRKRRLSPTHVSFCGL